jgi:hypothetical protein
LISRQEHEACEVLLACQGQLGLAPSGHVIGIHMVAALGLGAARGCDAALYCLWSRRVWSRRCVAASVSPE